MDVSQSGSQSVSLAVWQSGSLSCAINWVKVGRSRYPTTHHAMPLDRLINCDKHK